MEEKIMPKHIAIIMDVPSGNRYISAKADISAFK